MSVIGATAPDLRGHLGVGTAALTLAFVAQMLGAGIGSWLVGVVRHRLLELSLMAAVAALALVAALAAPGLAALAVAMSVTGLAAFVVNATAQAETMRRAGSQRSAALSRYHVWGGAGAAAFPLAVAALLAAGAPWQAAFGVLAAAYGTHAAVNLPLRLVPAPRPAGERRPAIGARGRWAIAVAILGGGLQFTFPLYLASLLVDRFGASEAVGSAGVSVYAAGMLMARVGGTRALARLGDHRELWLSCATLLGGYALLAVAEGQAVMFAAALFLGAGTGQVFPLGIARAAREIGDDRYASGLVLMLNCVAQMAVPAVVAVVLLGTDLTNALLLTAPLAGVIALAVHNSAGWRGPATR